MICLLCCNIYKKEIEAISHSEDFKDVKTFFFGAACFNNKDTKSRLKKQILKIKEECPESLIELIACSPCFKSRKEAAGLSPDNYKSLFDKEFGPNCNFILFENFNHLFVSKSDVDNYISQNAYLLTPGWLLKWEGHLKEWGFDKKTAVEFFSESVKKLVLLDTGTSDESLSKLKEFSLYLELPYEIVYTGLDFFKLNIEKIISSSKHTAAKKELQKNF